MRCFSLCWGFISRKKSASCRITPRRTCPEEKLTSKGQGRRRFRQPIRSDSIPPRKRKRKGKRTPTAKLRLIILAALLARFDQERQRRRRNYEVMHPFIHNCPNSGGTSRLPCLSRKSPSPARDHAPRHPASGLSLSAPKASADGRGRERGYGLSSQLLRSIFAAKRTQEHATTSKRKKGKLRADKSRWCQSPRPHAPHMPYGCCACTQVPYLGCSSLSRGHHSTRAMKSQNNRERYISSKLLFLPRLAETTNDTRLRIRLNT